MIRNRVLRSFLMFTLSALVIIVPGAAAFAQITNTGSNETVTNTGGNETVTNTGSGETVTNTGSTYTFAHIVDSIMNIVNKDVIPAMFAIAFLFFVASIARYFIMGQGNEEAREKGKQMAIYGIIGFVVLFGLWGIVNLLLGLLTSLGGVSATQLSQ